MTIHHTPSLSLFEVRSSVYKSAQSSSKPWSQSEPDLTRSLQRWRRTITMFSRESTASDSVATITSSLFARDRGQNRGPIPNENSNGRPAVVPILTRPLFELPLSVKISNSLRNAAPASSLPLPKRVRVWTMYLSISRIGGEEVGVWGAVRRSEDAFQGHDRERRSDAEAGVKVWR